MKTTTIPTELLDELIVAGWCACYLMDLNEPTDIPRIRHNRLGINRLEALLEEVRQVMDSDTANAVESEATP